MKSRMWFTIVVLCGLVLAVVPGAGWSNPGGFTQLTSDANLCSQAASVSADGSVVTFQSSADLVPGSNPDGWCEIFVINSDGSGLRQLTSDPGWCSQAASVSADGTVVAFQSSADLVPGGNSDLGCEIFVINSDGTGLRQLTSDSSLCSLFPSVSGDGAVVAFQSSADLVPGSNPDGWCEIFAVNSDGTGLRQLTSSTSYDSRNPTMNSDGSAVAFESRADLVAGGNSDHSWEVFVVNADGTGLRQLTSDGAYHSEAPSISADGSVVAFQSSADLVAGGNSDHSSEVFVINADGTGLRQLTSQSSLGGLFPSISGDASLVAFESKADLVPGGNSDHSWEVFVIDADGTGLRQLTSGPPSMASAMSTDGLLVAFESSADLTGGNPDHSNEVFVAAGLLAYTPEGTNVTIEPGAGVQVTFAQATSAGYTTITVSETPPPSETLSGFQFLGQYYDLSTDVSYTGPITISLPYGGADVPEGKERNLRVYQRDASGDWLDITVGVDTVNQRVIGRAATLSWFAGGYWDDGWTVTSQDLPALLEWDMDAAASVAATNTATTTWDSSYALVSAELDAEQNAFLVDRWGVTAVSVTGTVVPDADYLFDFTVTAPPWTSMRYVAPVTPTQAGVVDHFDCNWMLAHPYTPTPVFVTTDMAEQEVVVSRFPDIQPGTAGAWARFWIEECAGRVPLIVSGFADPDGPATYRPETAVDRAAMAVYMTRALKLPTDSYQGRFSDDVPDSHWAWPWIEALATAGLIQGYGPTKYAPDDLVTRDQMAVYVARGMVGSIDVPTGPQVGTFVDVPDRDPGPVHWAYDEVEYCVAHNVVRGYDPTHYWPDDEVTRDQMAVFVYKGFIMPTGTPVVLGGPEATTVWPATWEYDGWSTTSVNPVGLYVIFDRLRLGPNLVGIGSQWEIHFYLYDVTNPTGTFAWMCAHGFDASDMDSRRQDGANTGDPYLVVSAIRADHFPTLPPSEYMLVVKVEDETGTMYELPRKPTFTITP